MARVARVDIGGQIYHIINRAVGRNKCACPLIPVPLFLSPYSQENFPTPSEEAVEKERIKNEYITSLREMYRQKGI